MGVWIALFVSLLLVCCCSGEKALSSAPEEFLSHSRGQLFPSTWPLDHGDTARSKFVLNAGLPLNVSAADIKVIANNDLAGAQWLYTGGENSKYIYVIRGSAPNYDLDKLDSQSLQVLQTYKFQNSMYTGGMLIHSNGHVYAVYSNRFYVFWNGDLSNSTWHVLPTSLNNVMTQTNGMLVTQDGLIVVKQWPWGIADVGLMLYSSLMMYKIFYSLFAIIFIAMLARSMYFSKNRDSISFPRKASSALFFAFTVASIGTVGLVLFSKRSQLGDFSLVRYMLEGVLSNNSGGGQLKLIDPLTLEVRAEMDLPERCSFARMALTKIVNSDGENEDAIVLLGDENVHQVRWRPSTGELFWLPEWSRRYRKNGEGSFPGTGPSIYNETAYFTDNTFPVLLGQGSYSMFSMSVSHIEKDGEKIPITSQHYVSSKELHFPHSGSLAHYTDINHDFPALPKVSLVEGSTNKAGFMFWSVTILPEQMNGDAGAALVWDSAGRTVQARDLRDINKLLWIKRNVVQADCLTALPDKGHIYMTDYDTSPDDTNEWMMAIGKDSKYKATKKFFLVVNASTGEEIVRMPLPGSGMNPTLLVPGANNDVFMGTLTGVTRLYV